MATVGTLAQIGTQSWAGFSKSVLECLDFQAQLKWSLDDEFGRMSLEEEDGEPMVIQRSGLSGAAQQGIGCQQVGLAVVGVRSPPILATAAARSLSVNSGDLPHDKTPIGSFGPGR